ncbi:phospholipase A-2-activating protein [Orussus abietinus]|uniref:phospholipase A-2-activating protein n=1 Tax=Orussus abietinus TaxID=222816 RepID=UPI000626B593|nr:phospholipase A-2-activating protein [Orussus abietinus]
MAETSYKLCCTLYGHSLDVRALAAFKDGTVVSTSRDRTARVWKPSGDGKQYTVTQILRGHSHFISSVCVINPSERYTNGFIITGSNDNNICVYIPGHEEPVHTINAHDSTVCSLKAGQEEGTFLSSSWDLSAKLWKVDQLEKPVLTVKGHTAAVWCVADLRNGYIVTGSADKFVIVWSKDGCIVHKLPGHKDCVRGISVISDNQFLTCSNDATVCHWNATLGTCLKTYYGHENYIYSISSSLNGTKVVTSGEDRSVRVWINGNMEETIRFPSESVWCVKLLSNGDIAAGASDGTVRIFSANPERFADSQTLETFEKAVADLERQMQLRIGGIKISDLPDKSVLGKPGTKDGQTKMVKEGSTIKLYAWSQSEKKWTLQGDVMGVSGDTNATSGKQLYNGVEYDYVFSVDIQDGVPPLKLPYNRGEDPWHVAQKFIHDNELSQLFLDQVAKFIIKNSQSVPQLVTQSQYMDPFTGGSRYVPTAETSNSSNAKPMNDFTDNSKTSASPSYIPHKSYLKIEQANPPAILGKLQELNAKRHDAVHRISGEKLESVIKLANEHSETQFEIGAISVLRTLLDWPDEIVFPALDIARLAVLQRQANSELCSDELLQVVRRHIKPTAIPSNQMLTFRLLANMFLHEKGENLALRYRDELLKALLELPSMGSKNNQVAIATYMLNLIVALNKRDDTPGRTRVLNVMFTVLPLLQEPEAVFRALVGLGTVLAATPDPDDRNELIRAVRQSETALGVLRTMSESTVDLGAQNKLANCSKQIIDLII